MSCMAWGAATPWNGSTVAPTLSGSTYTIATAEELAWIAVQSQTEDFAGKTIRLTADLDLGGALETPAKWSPIGSTAMPFRGEIDGNNHVIYNLYIFSSSINSAGLIAETAAEANIHNLGLAQGKIMTDASNNIGSIVGVHRGTIQECFNMVQIVAQKGDNIGGLVGTNYGSIRYAYNTGIITDGNNHVGGLVGYNHASAVIDNCYNVGYCKGSDHVGALFGKNDAPEERLTKVVFDQQLTRMYATGYGANDPILTDNTKYAIENSDIFRRHTSPFYENPAVKWGDGYHPQLLCFKNHPASWLSTFAIGLDAENRPIERAEGVGAPKEGNEPRKTIWIQTLKNNLGVGQWYSPSPEVILIEDPSGDKAQVFRPCGNQEVILTQTYGEFVKQVYTIVKGYEVFDAGVVTGETWACWNAEDVKFKNYNSGGKEASGGKDDEQKNPVLSYQYMIIRDTVIDRANDVYEPLDTFYLTQEAYKDWLMPTDVPGDYAFRRYVKDYKCKTEWTVKYWISRSKPWPNSSPCRSQAGIEIIMSPSITAPVSQSRSQASGSNAPGVSSFSGKDSTSVSRSTPRNSRFTRWIPSASVSMTLMRQGTCTCSAASAFSAALRISAAAFRWPRFFTSLLTSISCMAASPSVLSGTPCARASGHRVLSAGSAVPASSGLIPLAAALLRLCVLR